MPEFTGERVIPGQVDQDLWNEHLARYLFAARLSRRRRVLDLACGAGYGTAELARNATHVTGVDIAADAVEHAAAHYSAPNVEFLQGTCTAVALPDQSFDLITAFECIEHLDDWQLLLTEAKRLLAPGGQFVVSTPNKSYYAESRRMSGANPFHLHEFEFDEFRVALEAVFPHVSLFVQNHSYGVIFQPLSATSAAEVRMEGTTPDPLQSHFFVAVCSMASQTGTPTFVYLPTTANVLREREQHIQMLEEELGRKNEWLLHSQEEHKALVEKHREQTAELEERNRWAQELDGKIQEARTHVSRLEKDLDEKTKWAQSVSTELKSTAAELSKCVDLLTKAEATVTERTLWAQSLETQLSLVRASRWHKMGRRFGLGPEVGEQ